ncbi:MAG: FHA domain-containing protein [Solirubrobacteraceae bacterium]
MMDEIDSRTLAGSSSFRCERCSYLLELADMREGLPDCPQCGAQAWARAPLATLSGSAKPANVDPAPAPAAQWIAETRAQIEQSGAYIAYLDGERTVLARLAPDSSRIGRSLSATVRFDDPTVSRRHALIVQGDEGARLLDDRSLNGVFVNGERVQECELRDGDEIMIGRYRLHYLVIVGAPAQTARA